VTAEDPQSEPDRELHRLLARWTAPVVPEDLDDRVLAAFRRQTGGRGGLWSRFFTMSVRVPVPVALGVVLLLLVTAALAMRPSPAPPTAGAPDAAASVQSARRADPPVVTRTSLAGFRPVTEVTATVVTATRQGAP
jgi:hypothetical protein